MSFPVSPSNNQVTTVNGIVYQYRSDKTAWIIVPSTAIGSASDTANAAFDKANSANVLAQAAFNTANTALFKSGFDNGLTANVVTISNTTASISNTTGALIVVGGVGISGNLYVSGNIVDTTGNTYLKQDAAGNVIVSGTLTVQNTNILLQLQNAFNKANAANVLAQAAYNQANSASSNTIVLAAIDVSQNSNISFLTGFSQGAYDKANTNSSVANSTAAVANIVAAGLVATNTNVAIALAGVAAANSNISFLTGFSQGAYDKANAANVLAQAAYDNSNTKFSSSGGNITGDVTIINGKNLLVTGNLTVQGNLVSTNTQQFSVADPLILLGLGNYYSDVKDIGFASHYNDGVNAHAGFIRDYSTKEWYLFKGYIPELDANNELNIADASFKTANLNADIVRSNLIGTTATVNNIELGGFTTAAYRAANVIAAGLVATNTNTAIALAGVQAANSNISFLTGFSQGAYDKANTALQNTANIITAGNLTVSSNLTIGGGVGGSITGVNTVSSNTINAIDVNITGNLIIAGANIVNSLALANSNISFLTGFSQGAYDKANTTATVANSTALVANIVAAGLVATNTNTAIALAGVAAANSNISFLTGFSQNAFNKANAAYDYANTISGGITTFTQGAYDKANSASSNTVVIQAVDVSQNANIAIALAGVAAANSNINFLTGYSQGAYALANVVQAGLNATNTNTAIALAGVAAANSNINFLTGYSQGAYALANVVQAGLNATNTNVAIALAGVDAANANIAILFNSVNSGNVNSAGLNAANANISFLLAFSQGAYDKANAANVLAQAAFDVANTAAGGTSDIYARGLAQGAYNKANAAYDFANTISGSSSFGGGTVANATYFANNTISTSPITGALRVAGGFGVGGDVFIAGNLTIGEANVINSLNLANSNISFLTSFSQGAYDKANAANVLAQASYNSANIIQAGLVAANSNISFLTSFSQGAYTLANITQAGLVATNTNTAIALAGVAAANSNIEFLIGYSQGAYALANVAKAGLDATNTNTAIALAGVAAANSNISFLTGFSQGAYNKANAAYDFAQSAYDSSNTKFSSSGGNISGDVTIINGKNLLVTGNLTVQGNLISTNTQSFTVADPLILLGLGNYYSDVLDIGFASHYNDGVNAHAGFVRDSSTKEWYLFKGYTPELDANNNLNIADASFRTANLNADIVRGNLIGTTATVNNIELGGFTAAAYDKANTTATVANSTAVVANIISAGLVSTNTNTAIALAGVAAANSNISFLTGFSQGAYDKANTTATVANSTAVVANIVAAGLVATNTNTAIALAGVAAANSNISFLTGFSQNAFNKANAAYDYANTISGGITTFTQGAYDKANSANVLAQSAFDKANIGGGITVTTAPTPPASGNTAGSQWYNTTNDTLYEYTTTDGVYYYWIDMASPAFSSNAITFTGVSSGKAIAFSLIFGG